MNKRTLLATCLTGAFLWSGTAPAYWGDNADVADGPHSSFHYEFSRVLARAAGFSTADAEFIAVMTEVTDRMSFQGTGPSSPMVQLWGTERIGPTDAYFHWPRRGSYNVTGEYQHPGGRDSCSYFTGSTGGFGFGFISSGDVCPNGVPEINQIENWAVFGSGSPSVGTPRMILNLDPEGPVQGGTLAALGIYLHALADTYSHEACMKKVKIRGHRNTTTIHTECSVVRWHENEEFGKPTSTANKGTSYTKEAGMATWKALLFYRAKHGLAEPALWTDAQAQSFINTWADKDAALDRLNYANQVNASLN